MIGTVIRLGRQIYDVRKWRELHRFIVLVGRSLFHLSALQSLYDWFQQSAVRREILKRNAFPIEQVTRAFFYAGATFSERDVLLRAHYALLEASLAPDWAVRLGAFDARCLIWQAADGSDWHAELTYEPGQRKEGCLSVKMVMEGAPLYQIMFWLGRDSAGETALFVGAMQGPNVEHAKELVKEATKRAHRYRTKNLILYMTQAVARALGMEHLYAVSNAGYYANNHVRRDRKLKTDFGAFWEEAGGHVTDDPRFFELPLVEMRKSEEEIPTRKRATYRKRFAFQDDVDAQIAARVGAIRIQNPV